MGFCCGHSNEARSRSKPYHQRPLFAAEKPHCEESAPEPSRLMPGWDERWAAGSIVLLSRLPNHVEFNRYVLSDLPSFVDGTIVTALVRIPPSPSTTARSKR